MKTVVAVLVLFAGSDLLAKPRKKPSLAERANNPCALSWSYSFANGRPTSLFWMLQEKGVPVAKEGRDLRGNVVMKFATPADGEKACRILLRSEYYRSLDLATAIEKWSGGHSSRSYAAYVRRRTGLPLHGVAVGALNDRQLGMLRQAQSEWESGRTKKGRIIPPVPKKPKRHRLTRR